MLVNLTTSQKCVDLSTFLTIAPLFKVGGIANYTFFGILMTPHENAWDFQGGSPSQNCSVFIMEHKNTLKPLFPEIGHGTYRLVSYYKPVRNSFGTHDPQISTDRFHYGYVSLVHFRIITVEVMEVLHEYLLFALLRRILPPVYQINVLSVHK